MSIRQHNVAADVRADAVLKCSLEKRNGKEYIKIDKLDLVLHITNYNVHLDNLFNGDKTLGDAVNAALNENKKEIIATVSPTVRSVVSEVLLEIAKKITSHFTYDELFPKN
ncbi:hypothetical protein AAG570_000530 [Ranatra chinensis]|uniref:Uncharacterized protein n=1 Tax=Ranatra chinensis TaxID=642074 RepID=A0ABD0YXC1_9HEMI